MASIVIISAKKSKEQLQRESKESNDINARFKALTPAGRKQAQQLAAARKAIIENIRKVDTALFKYEKYRGLFALGYTAFLILLPQTVFAATANGGIALIKLMQQASFWVGIGVVIWGIVEAQLDLPGWKSRILKGVLGYIAILVVPLLFVSLRDNLQIDMWQQLNQTPAPAAGAQ